jgi:hypothetical protein
MLFQKPWPGQFVRRLRRQRLCCGWGSQARGLSRRRRPSSARVWSAMHPVRRSWAAPSPAPRWAELGGAPASGWRDGVVGSPLLPGGEMAWWDRPLLPGGEMAWWDSGGRAPWAATGWTAPRAAAAASPAAPSGGVGRRLALDSPRGGRRPGLLAW